MAIEFEPFAWRPTLWKARVLHFQGHEKGDVDSLDGRSRRSRRTITAKRSASTPARKSGRPIACSTALASEPKKKIYSAAKDAASYWVGLLLFDEGQVRFAPKIG